MDDEAALDADAIAGEPPTKLGGFWVSPLLQAGVAAAAAAAARCVARRWLA